MVKGKSGLYLDKRSGRRKDPTSILNYFKKVVSFRKENPSLIYGSYHLLDAENPQSYTFLRKTGADTYLIMLNFSPRRQSPLRG